MLPAKIDLTEQLSSVLKKIRLTNPVNGETLTAEKLSISIGNNRAWMSQIESRRLKKIKREDIIKIYKLLFNIDSDNEAENKAAKELSPYFNSSNDVKENKSINWSEETQKRIDKRSIKICDKLKQVLLEYTASLDNMNQLLINMFISKITDYIQESPFDTLAIISALSLNNYKYASDEQKKIIKKKIDELQNELSKLNCTREISIYLEHISFCKSVLELKEIPESINFVDDDSLSLNLSHLVEILSEFGNEISLQKKIELVNDYIELINLYSKYKNDTFYFDTLPENSDINIIKSTLDYIQIYVNGLENNHDLISNKISNIIK